MAAAMPDDPPDIAPTPATPKLATAEPTAAADTSGTSTPSTPADAAKARREARKAKILGAGNDRLARITRSGRGADADALYPPTASSPSASASGSGATGAASASAAAAAARARSSSPYLDEEPLGGPLAGVNRSDDPLGLGPGAGLAEGDAGGFDFASILAKLQQHAAAEGAEGGAGSGLPFDMNQLLSLAGMMQGGGANGAGGPPPPRPPGGSAPGQQSAAAGAGAPLGRTKLDKSFDLLRAGIMLLFAFFAVSSLFSRPSTNLLTGTGGAKAGIVSHDDHQAHLLQRWASLAYRKPAEWEAQFFQMESFGLTTAAVPIFWLFLSVEIAVQSTRILLFRNRPAPPSILTTALNILPVPPQLAQLIRTGASYIGLASALLNDLAIVLFGVGMTILWAQWKTGMTLEGASAMGGAWDAAVQGQGAEALAQASASAVSAAGVVSQTASAAFEAVTEAVGAGAAAAAAAQRAAEL